MVRKSADGNSWSIWGNQLIAKSKYLSHTTLACYNALWDISKPTLASYNIEQSQIEFWVRKSADGDIWSILCNQLIAKSKYLSHTTLASYNALWDISKPTHAFYNNIKQSQFEFYRFMVRKLAEITADLFQVISWQSADSQGYYNHHHHANCDIVCRQEVKNLTNFLFFSFSFLILNIYCHMWCILGKLVGCRKSIFWEMAWDSKKLVYNNIELLNII